jgi:transcriptional regulator with XRE-family HTH domain
VRGGHLVKEARRRAGITQSELARRLGTTQSAIARTERGESAPSLESLSQAVRACGLELQVSLVGSDDSDWSLVEESLKLGPSERVQRLIDTVRFIASGREALRASRGR